MQDNYRPLAMDNELADPRGERLPELTENAATVSSGSDRYPATVLSDDGRYITVQYDDDVVIDGSMVDGSAKYAYYRNPVGMIRNFKRRADGKLVEVYLNPRTGRMNQRGFGARLYLGRRNRYYDPHF